MTALNRLWTGLATYVSSNFIEGTMNLLLGFILGIMGSFMIWYLLAKIIAPSITFYPEISKIPSGCKTPKFIYRFKYGNTGKRSIMDVKIYATLKVKGLEKSRPNNIQLLDIPLEEDYAPLMNPINPLKWIGTNKGGRWRVVNFKLEKLWENQLHNYFGTKSRRILSLERLFQLKEYVELEIVIFCYDKFSGARKIFVKSDYKKDKIRFGTFATDSLTILEWTSAS